ncbi:MAG: AraC family transcriptional regulator [Eubacteriales bacterium]|nr:AraC family transcriptional regulator [Eubacteriales bacterium]
MRSYEGTAFSAELNDKNGGLENGGVLPSSKMFLHLPSEFARSALLYAAYVGHYFCDQTYVVRRNQFDYFLLAVIDSGGMFFEYNQKRFEVHAGEVILLDCRQPHVYGAIGSVSFRYIYFRGGSSEIYYKLLAGEKGYFKQPVRSIEIQSAIQSIFALVTDKTYNEHRISAQLYRILAELAGEEKQESIQNTAVLHAIAYMERHFPERLSIEKIADQVNLSEYYFSRLFRKCTSVSPHAYLVNLRITMARQLLTVSQKSVERIAEECGFHSTTNFIRSFREHVGCTPKQFRRAAMAELSKINENEKRK